MTVRWLFIDPATAETYTVEINPNQMSSPFRPNNSDVLVRDLAARHRAPPMEWTFGGVIRTKTHYDSLLAWSQRSGRMQIVDHLGRRFEVCFIEFVPDEKRTTVHNDTWHFNYSMRVLLTNYLGVS